MSHKKARSYTILSIATAVATIALKAQAYFLTGSVGLLSDALESGINLIAAIVAFWALSYAAKPPDEEHPFGHTKAEYFSSGLESGFIILAAISIIIAAWPRLLNPQPLEKLDIGLTLSLIASVLNGVVAWILLQAGKRLRSITLRADAHHLFTDVWTSIGVILGILLVKLTGWLVLDPIIALLVAANIIWVGTGLLKETASELLDQAIPREDRQIIHNILIPYEEKGIKFHALRTTMSGSRRMISFHVLVPGIWTVIEGHNLCEELELTIIRDLPGSYVITHLEPVEDPTSWSDENIDRNV